MSARIGRLAAWVVVLPLRPLVILDGPLGRVLHYPHLSVALTAVARV
ncbi:MAG TPA: hypothetical protein VHY83_05060 [Solirubrobacteraceae bacterium]|nr:hypothetical protein [Solirubrobacteraceae bacterium]